MVYDHRVDIVVIQIQTGKIAFRLADHDLFRCRDHAQAHGIFVQQEPLQVLHAFHQRFDIVKHIVLRHRNLHCPFDHLPDRFGRCALDRQDPFYQFRQTLRIFQQGQRFPSGRTVHDDRVIDAALIHVQDLEHGEELL